MNMILILSQLKNKMTIKLIVLIGTYLTSVKINNYHVWKL